MSGVTLKIDTKGVTAKLNGAKDKIPTVLAKELNIWAIRTANDAKTAAPIDEGQLRRAIQPVQATKENLKASVVVALNYAAFIEFGTRSFAAAYVATLPANWKTYAASFKGGTGGSYSDFILRLMGWIKRKGIGDESLAYVIARKIMRTGIRPRRFLFPAVMKNRDELLKRLKA